MLIRHSVLYIVAKFLPGIIGVATTAILTRLLNPAQYGVYGLTLVIMTFVSGIGFDWLSVSVQRFYATRRDDPRTIATFINIFLILMSVSAGLAILIWVLGDFRKADEKIYALGLALAWSYSWFELVAIFEVANFRPLRYLSMNLGRAVLILLGAGGAAWMTHDPIWTAAATGAGLLAGTALGTFESPRLGLRYFNRDLAMQILGFGLPLAISLTLGVIITGGTRMLLVALDSSEALGLYTAAFFLVNGLSLIASGISSAGYQLAVRAVEGGDSVVERRQILDIGALLLAVLAPACLGIALTADGIALILVGPKFQPAVSILTPWMAAGVFFASFRANFLDYAFQLGKRPNLQAWVTAVAAITAIGLSVYLIPRKGPLGAAIAVTVAMAISCCLAAVVGRWAHAIPLPVGAAARIIFCCIFMAALVLAVPGSGTEKFAAQIAVGALGYICAVLALNVLDLRTFLISYISGRA